MSEYLLELRKASVYYPGIKALDGVDFSLKEGQIHALIGENGAGKSTLVKVLTGIASLKEGEILIDGRVTHFRDPIDAQKAGIAGIHQEAIMFPELSITENIFMGHQKRLGKTGLLDRKSMKKRTQELLTSLGLKISADALVKNLSSAGRHMVEIAKALSFDARVVIMDEPTSALSQNEINELFDIVRQLKKNGKTILFISHKFDEIFSLCDSYTVLRDGKLVGSGRLSEIDIPQLIQLMVGRSVDRLFPKHQVQMGETVLEVRKLSQMGVFRDVSFSLRRGEILGFFGLIGSGRSEVMNALVGIEKPDSGEVLVQDHPVKLKSLRDAIRHHIGYVPEDRQNQGAVVKMSIKKNITLPQIDVLSTLSWIRKKKEESLTVQFGEQMEVRAVSYDQPVNSLSGGNQQKVILAKWLATNPEILILDEPTKGIDVATKSAVYKYISQMASDGMAIILVSSELPEILGLADTIVVMHDGKVTARISRALATSESVMHAALNIETELTGAL